MYSPPGRNVGFRTLNGHSGRNLVGSGICDGGDCPYSREQDESVLHYGFMEDNTLLRRAEQVIHQSETTSRR